MPQKITIIRHGETDYNSRNILQGQLPIPLNAKGIEQVKRAAKKLEREIFDAIYSSDLLRTVQTAEIVAHKNIEKIIKTSHIRERSLGTLEGKHKDIAFKTLGVIKDGFPLHHFWDFIEQKEHKVLKLEAKKDLFVRTKQFIDKLHDEFNDKHVLLVSHGGTIRVLLHHLGFTDHDFLKKIVIKNAAILHLTKKGDGYDLKIDDEHV